MALRADRLKQLRTQREYTQEELASLIESSLRMLQRYENGDSDPTADVLERMVKILGCTADYLLGLADEPDGSFVEEDLTEMERLLIIALREGRIRPALNAFNDLAAQSDDD